MPAIALTTFKDATERVLDYLGENASKLASRDAKRAVFDAYRDLASAHRWTYLFRRGRLDTVASYTTGTITFTFTGGAYERVVTLASGTWPSWAANGRIIISSVVYEVATRESNTQITLSVNSNPGANVAAGTSYTLYRDTYTLPVDFLAAGDFYNNTNVLRMRKLHPEEMVEMSRSSPSPATPRSYSITGSEDFYGVQAVTFYPPPDAIYRIDYLYHRRMRPLVYGDQAACSQGTVTNTAASATVTGTSTAFASGMVGSVIRLSANTVDLPTPPWGANPYDVERVITGFTSTTSITVNSTISAAHTAVKYQISDPLDLEEGAMQTAFWRCMEAQATIARIMKNEDKAQRRWLDALILAKEADSRSMSNDVSGVRSGYTRLRDHPADLTFV